MTLDALLRRSAEAAPDAIALIEADRTTTYGALDDLASRCARGLRARGVAPGDRVLIALENSALAAAVYFGVVRAGAIAVPVLAGPRSDRLPAVVSDCAPRLAIVDESTAQGAQTERALAEVSDRLVISGEWPSAFPAGASQSPSRDPGALAAIVYTSGSTGEPRGVMLTHRNFVANAQSIVEYLALSAHDRVMCVLPFHYVYGLSLLHTHVAVGGSLVLENRAAFANVVLDGMQRHRVTGFAGVPSTFALMLHRSNIDGAALPDLRYVTQAGGPMPPANIDAWRAKVPHAAFFVMYGATEAAARLTYLPPQDLARKSGSIGRAIPGVEVRVLADDGRETVPGEIGELVARGDNVATGYWNRPEETAARFDSDGYHTGDLGYVDGEGFLFLVGRRHDMIKVGANRVGAREIENVLCTHPSVFEAAVVATPHDLLGEAPVAVVSLRAPLDDAALALRAFMAERMPPYKVPVRVVILDELPKLPGSGKIAKSSLLAIVTDPSG